MHPLVLQIEELFLPELERLASQMRGQFPDLKFHVWHSQSGTSTDYQGHDLGIECVFPRTTKDISDNLALIIDLCHLGSRPKIMASVGWGHPSRDVEADFKDYLTNAQWPEATQETIEELRADFPRLIQVFVSATQRGVPLQSI